MERNMKVRGRELNFASTYDGDAQYNVQVRSGDKLITMFKVAAEEEDEVFDSAIAQFTAEVDLGHIKL
ncbi:hypothetical protein ACQCN2_14575 [Brevibacillus ginsengisoli]|uniref:hypothetical protein n=1 Tax=Brevibacillus ginsengisoli TaxID=363854 RepID=UPI003CE77C74